MGTYADHGRVTELVDQAEAAKRRGAWREAADLYMQAADLEQAVLMAIPRDRTRTRAVVAQSLSAILFRRRGALRRYCKSAPDVSVRPVDGRGE